MQHRVSDFAMLDETLFLSSFKKETHFISFGYTLDILQYDILVNACYMVLWYYVLYLKHV